MPKNQREKNARCEGWKVREKKKRVNGKEIRHVCLQVAATFFLLIFGKIKGHLKSRRHYVSNQTSNELTGHSLLNTCYCNK